MSDIKVSDIYKKIYKDAGLEDLPEYGDHGKSVGDCKHNYESRAMEAAYKKLCFEDRFNIDTNVACISTIPSVRGLGEKSARELLMKLGIFLSATNYRTS